MRYTLHKFLNRYPNNLYFLHCDMWKWSDSRYNIINCGIQEPNMVNIAAGLASQGQRVIIYGVAGFVIYKSYEQIKLNIKGWAEKKGSVIFINAGANGCYSKMGRGHTLDDDEILMKALDIPLFDPIDTKTFIKCVFDGLNEIGVRYVRLGWDNEVWKK